MNAKNSLALLMLLAAGGAHAAPREHINCPIVQKIVEPSGSAGYRMSQDCQSAYVLPPQTGQIRVSPIITPDSASTCSAIMGSVNALSAENQVLVATVREKASLDAQISADRQACTAVHGQQTAIQTRLDQIGADIATVQASLDSAKKTQSDCQTNPEAVACDTIDEKVGNLEDRLSTLNDKAVDVNQASEDVKDRVASCESRHPHAQSDNTSDIAQMDKLNLKIAELSKKVTSERKRLSALPGGDATMSFSSGQPNLVRAFHDQNQGLGINFVAMPLKKARIHFELVRDGSSANLTSVARFKIFGARDAGPSAGAPEVPADGVDVGAADAERLFGGAVGAQISLNLYAACNLRQRFADLASPQARAYVANLVNPTVNYEYELQASKDIQINYNQTYLYQLIKEHTTHGGLFWSSSSESITENTVANKWLTIIESSEDSDMKFENPEKLLFDMRREVLDAALGRIAQKTYASPGEAIADGGTPPEDGAKVASKALHQYPNIYCQVAAIALDVSDALFGGSSVTDSTTKTVKTSDVQNLVINGMVTFSGSQSFEPAGS